MFIPLGIVLGLFVVGYAAMSRHVANAGAFYAYVARGLGKVQGVGAAFVALIAYNAMQIGIYGLFGVAMGAFMADKIGITLEWWVWCLIAGAVIGAARRAADRPQRARARRAADPRGGRRRAVRLRDPRRPRPAGPDDDRARPDGRVRHRGRRHADVLRGRVRGLRVGGDLQRGVPRPEAHGRPRDVHRRRADRRLLRALELAAERRRRAGHDRQPGRARRRAASRPATRPTRPRCCSSPARTGSARSGATPASLLFATSLFAALLSFHNAVARYAFALGREGVLPGVVRAREPAHRRAVDRLRRRRPCWR